MIVALDHRTQLTAFTWMIAGLAIYFLYSKKHSRLNEPAPEVSLVQPD
jgi:APA family basic amino acid/polyamine antiporter